MHPREGEREAKQATFPARHGMLHEARTESWASRFDDTGYIAAAQGCRTNARLPLKFSENANLWRRAKNTRDTSH